MIPAVPNFDGAPFTQARTVTNSGSNPSLARTPDGGFIVSWTEPNGTDLDVRARVFTAAGEPVGGFGSSRGAVILGTLTDASQDFPFVATNADHALFAWQDGGVRSADGSPSGVRGASFLMVNAPTHSDVSGDGVDDLLWRRGDGLVAEWLMTDGHIVGNNNLATIAASYQLQDTGDLNGDAFSDVLWRHEFRSGRAVDDADASPSSSSRRSPRSASTGATKGSATSAATDGTTCCGATTPARSRSGP